MPEQPECPFCAIPLEVWCPTCQPFIIMTDFGRAATVLDVTGEPLSGDRLLRERDQARRIAVNVDWGAEVCPSDRKLLDQWREEKRSYHPIPKEELLAREDAWEMMRSLMTTLGIRAEDMVRMEKKLSAIRRYADELNRDANKYHIREGHTMDRIADELRALLGAKEKP